MDSILDSAPCGFVSFADDGTMLEVNATLADHARLPRVELEGWHLQKILPPGGRIFYQTHVFPLLKLHGMARGDLSSAAHAGTAPTSRCCMNGSRRERDGRPVNDCVFVRMLQRHAFEDQLLEARRLAEEANARQGKVPLHDVARSAHAADRRSPDTRTLLAAG